METPIILNGQHLPKPEGNQECDFCNPHKFFETWDLLAGHITIVHNDNGRKRSFHNGEASAEILNHPDWTGYEAE